MSRPLTGRTIAVTGAAGFIGAQTVARLAGEACTILRVARSSPPPIRNATANVVDVIGDVAQPEIWHRIVEAEVIFHFAAQTSVAAAAADPPADFRANVAPIGHLIAACRHRRRQPIAVFAGTVTEAGVPSRMPVNEDVADEPVTVYDRHKLTAETGLKRAAAEGVVRAVTLRLANVYGPGAHGRRADRDVLNRMIGAAMKGEPLTIYGAGEYVRDYVFVEDVVAAFVAAAGHIGPLNAHHFVIGSGRGTTIRDAFELVAARVERVTGRRVTLITQPAAPLSPIERRHFIANHSSFSQLTGWRPQWTLADGIDRTIEALTCAS